MNVALFFISFAVLWLTFSATVFIGRRIKNANIAYPVATLIGIGIFFILAFVLLTMTSAVNLMQSPGLSAG